MKILILISYGYYGYNVTTVNYLWCFHTVIEYNYDR